MTEKQKILIINGPNLNLLGKREPETYGYLTLQDINNNLTNIANKFNIILETYQSNLEGDIVNKIQDSIDKISFIIINAAAYTHTSIAIRDALLAVKIPFYEIHISNIFNRDEFRKHSYLSDIALGIISGFGTKGYDLSLLGAVNYLNNK